MWQKIGSAPKPLKDNQGQSAMFENFKLEDYSILEVKAFSLFSYHLKWCKKPKTPELVYKPTVYYKSEIVRILLLWFYRYSIIFWLPEFPRLYNLTHVVGEVPSDLADDGLHGLREVQGLGQAPGHRYNTHSILN